MSLGRSIPRMNGREPLALARGLVAGSVAEASPANEPDSGAECDVDAEIGAAISRWRRLRERLESVAADADLAEALACWLRIGAEPFGASGGFIEVSLGGAGCGTLRASFGIDERSARAVSGACAGDGTLAVPCGSEIVTDLAESEPYGGLLVRPLLEHDGVRGMLSAPLSSKSGFTGVVRYFFTQPLAASERVRALSDLLAMSLGALIDARIVARKLHAAEQRLHAVLDGAGDGIIAVAADGRIVEANDATALIFGYKRDELRGLPLSTLFPRAHARILGECAAGPDASTRRFEFEAERRDGSGFIAEAVVGSAALQQGRTIVVRDASARRTADARLRQCERLASIGTLAAGLGHDLNNTLLPMRARFAALARPRRRLTREERDAHFAQIRGGLDHIQSLADALHFLATESEDATAASTTLAAWWNLTGPLLAKALHDRASLEVAIDPALPRVALDEHSLTRAALALLTNAGEAMPRERPRELSRVLVRARVHDGGARVALEFCDNGMGMSDEVRRRAFDAYFTTKIRAIGTGLGLPIVRGVVERAGGEIELDTQAGVGTTVRLMLPVERSRDGSGDAAPSPRAACHIGDGRISAVVATILAAEGVEEVVGHPRDADIWIVSDEQLTEECAARWCSMRAASQLVVLGVRQDARCDAAMARGATVVRKPLELPFIEAAIRQALASAKHSVEHTDRS